MFAPRPDIAIKEMLRVLKPHSNSARGENALRLSQ
jgi:hypothetical protein